VEIIRSRAGVPIRLTDERWKHISKNHPEVAPMRQEILEAIAEADVIQRGDSGELIAVRKYERTPMTSKFLIVAYREVSREDGFILTAYLTSRPSSSRSVVWKR
jgi:hypothetical protein